MKSLTERAATRWKNHVKSVEMEFDRELAEIRNGIADLNRFLAARTPSGRRAALDAEFELREFCRLMRKLSGAIRKGSK